MLFLREVKQKPSGKKHADKELLILLDFYPTDSGEWKSVEEE
jgi:hypothetical protein